MELRSIGVSGLKVSALGLGCNNFGGRQDEAATKSVVDAALDAGVTLFDTADVYPMGMGGKSEEFVGKALGARRADVVLATKFGMKMDEAGLMQGGSRRYIIDAVEASLKRLGTDWIDLLQFHKPDPSTPIDETLRALDDLIHAGKVRYIGCSNFAAWQMVEAHYVARELGANRFICTQDHYSLLARRVEQDVLPVCQAYGMGFLPFFPLASGILSGKYQPGKPAPENTRLTGDSPLGDRFLNQQNLDIAAKLSDLAETFGCALIDLAFAYLLKSPQVPSVIAGASRPEQVVRNAAAVGWKLTDAQYGEVDALLRA
tara:strand:+ start:106097 stop:107044 length:948 start_codon:yes stop_codon:yes gene_type:complete